MDRQSLSKHDISTNLMMPVRRECGWNEVVQITLRDSFLRVRRAQDKAAAHVLREFMRKYVEEAEKLRRAGHSAKAKSEARAG